MEKKTQTQIYTTKTSSWLGIPRIDIILHYTVIIINIEDCTPEHIMLI